jgi:hypothetical protein
MKSISSIAVAALVSALAISCSPLPQTSRTDEQLSSIRAEYLNNHPDGKFNDHIKEGRVVKGMGILEVLASWGLPNARSASESGTSENWAYYAKDEQTNRLVSYELVFEDKVLRRWQVRADLGTGLGTTDTDPGVTRTIEETLRLGTDKLSTESTGKKKSP